MSLFTKILEKLGLRKDKEEEKPATTGASAPQKPAATAPSAKPAPSAKTPTSAPTAKPATSTAPSAKPAAKPAPQPGFAGPTGSATTAAAAPKPMSQVDVMTMLEQKAKGTGLNWKQSISDLLFLLDLDNSREARTELAKELGAPDEVMGDSARMNTWLHKTVLRKIAENGGNIPQELMD